MANAYRNTSESRERAPPFSHFVGARLLQPRRQRHNVTSKPWVLYGKVDRPRFREIQAPSSPDLYIPGAHRKRLSLGRLAGAGLGEKEPQGLNICR